jgi:mannose-1-phosphate guanylyltransferase
MSAPVGVRALVLAAGLGTRLRPLTDELPKPLLPVLGETLLERTLRALAAAGCEAAAINLHHLPAAIPAALGERFAGMPLLYSHEEPVLGTGGALVPLRGFFARCETVLVVNGDSLCRWPLPALLARHRRSGAAATLLLAGRPDPRAFGGGVGIDRAGLVTELRGQRAAAVVRRHVFAGAHALRPELLDRLPPGVSDSMRDLYAPLLAEGGRLAAEVTWRPWHDLGTPERYLAAALDWARRESGGGWMAASVSLAKGARSRESVLESAARVGAGACATRSLLLAGASLGEGAQIDEVVVGPAVALPAGCTLSRTLVTRATAHGAPRAAGARADPSLVFTPF